MEYVKLGTSKLDVSEIALGLMRIDSLSHDEIVTLLESAYEQGINFYDLADVYGRGKVEELFGEALKDTNIPREKIIIQTKTGIEYVSAEGKEKLGYNFSKNHILKSVDESLQRMQLDYVDTLLLHRTDALMDPNEVAEAFNQLLHEGKVRYFGVSNMNGFQFDLLQSRLNFDLVIDQLQFGLGHTGMVDFGFFNNMADDEGIERDGGIYPYMMKNNITLQTWSPYQYGHFEGIFIDNPKFPELNEELEKIAQAHGVTKNAIASAWILRLPMSVQVIAGTTKPSRLAEITAGSGIELNHEEWYALYQAAGHKLP